MTKRIAIAAVIALAACLLGWRFGGKAFLGAYLVAWWFWMGTALGAQANVWLHNLTGGRWGEVIREPLQGFARTAWVAAVFFLPLLLGLHVLYPWALDAHGARWAGELSAPEFKRAWLMPAPFAMRSVFYLALWSLLIWLGGRDALRRSKPFAAFGLIAYGFSVGLASVDWVMSLMPLWFSSVFGWLVGVGQMLAGMALAIVLAARRPSPPSPPVFRDLGNLMLMYVMTWAYLAFSEFLIIWAENLPHEILWYVARRQGPWLALAWILAGGLFAAPLLILLSRHVKQSALRMRQLAAALLVMQFLNCCWLILPSLAVPPAAWLWAVPLCAIAMGAVVRLLAPWWRASREGCHARKEAAHA